MIPFNFIYFRPKTIKEATAIFADLLHEGKNAVYYAGGSEVISMCRTGSIKPDAVIDIKNIQECKVLYLDGQGLHMGAACTLNQISESKLFPLLRLSCGRIADHTNQCRITLGGNLCSTIIYRETSLPLLLADAEVTLCSTAGERKVSFFSIFDKRMQLKQGEIMVQVRVPQWALSARHFHIKKTKNEKIDYPLVSISAIGKGDYLRVAFSGVCSYPFRSEKLEAVLNERAKSKSERVDGAVKLLPEPVYNDIKGSGEYRLFVLKHTLHELLEEWENDTISR